MKGLLKVFEIRLKSNGKLITLHRPGKNGEQAAKRVGRGKQIISVKKVDPDKLFGNIEHLPLDFAGKGLDLGGGIHEEDIDIDSVLGLRKNNRRSNDGSRQKDKERH